MSTAASLCWCWKINWNCGQHHSKCKDDVCLVVAFICFKQLIWFWFGFFFWIVKGNLKHGGWENEWEKEEKERPKRRERVDTAVAKIRSVVCAPCLACIQKFVRNWKGRHFGNASFCPVTWESERFQCVLHYLGARLCYAFDCLWAWETQSVA